MEISRGQKRSKLIDSSNIKSIDDEKKTISAYISTFQWDRMDERFSKGAWKMENYLKNPVVLWAHNYGDPPIAKAISIGEDEQGLFSNFKFDEESEFAMKIFSLFKRGFMNAFSVGFDPMAWNYEGIEGTERKGIVWTDAELLEFSAVPIPANPGALMMREDAEFIRKSFGNHFIKSMKEGSVEKFILTDGKKEETLADWEIQSLILPKKFWSLEEAKKWIEDHGYRSDKTDETEESYRFRQKEPSEFSEFKMICINPDKDTPQEDCKVKAVYGMKKGISEKQFDLEKIMKSLTEFVKIQKNEKLDDKKLSLVKMTMQTLQEIIFDNEIDKKEIEELGKMVKELAEVIKTTRPDIENLISKFMIQFEMAMRNNSHR